MWGEVGVAEEDQWRRLRRQHGEVEIAAAGLLGPSTGHQRELVERQCPADTRRDDEGKRLGGVRLSLGEERLHHQRIAERSKAEHRRVLVRRPGATANANDELVIGELADVAELGAELEHDHVLIRAHRFGSS